MMRALVTALMCATALTACSPAAEEKPAAAEASGPDAITPHNPLFGEWEMTAARIAPWWDGKGDEPAPNPAMAHISFSAAKSTGSPLVACDKPHYAVNLVPQRGLFEGNLPEPAKDAAAIGFKDSSVSVISFSCEANDRDVSLDFPMIDDDSIALGLDNVVYTYKRTGG